jgi:hypothetical protein
MIFERTMPFLFYQFFPSTPNNGVASKCFKYFLFGPSDLSDFHFWWYPLMTQAILAAGGCGGLAAAGCRAGSAGLYVHGAIFQQLPHAPLSDAGCPCGKKIEKNAKDGTS